MLAQSHVKKGSMATEYQFCKAPRNNFGRNRLIDDVTTEAFDTDVSV